MNEPKRSEPRWLSAILVRAIHADQIRHHGGSVGLRDADLLHSALARARHRWHDESDAGLVELATAYGFGLVRNHPFVDGNKRIAFQAMYVFLGLNGWRTTAEEPEVVEVIMNAANGTLEENQLADWLRNHIEPR